MSYIAKYYSEIGFDWDIGRLLKENVDLRSFDSKNIEFLFSQMTIDLLMLKAIKEHFREEKIISNNARERYKFLLEDCLKLTEDVEGRRDSLPFEMDYNLFTQEQILFFHKAEQFEHIKGMANFAGKEYCRIFGKNKKF